MWAYVGAALVGAVAMGRTKPKTKIRKLSMLGNSSGRTYHVEENLVLGTVFIHTPDGGIGVLQRQPDKTLKLIQFKGHPQDQALMRRDFEPPRQG